MYRLDKSTGYYLKKYKLLKNIIKAHSSWQNDCEEEKNAEAKLAIIRFYYEYKKCKPDKEYCVRMELGHFSYLSNLLPLRKALIEGLYQRACNEIYSLLYYEYFLQRRIRDNLLSLLVEYFKIGT